MEQQHCHSPPSCGTTKRMALVADDHSLFRTGLSMLLMEEFGFVQIAEAETLASAELMLARYPDTEVAFFDLLMPGVQDPSSLDAIRAAYPRTRFVIVSGCEDYGQIERTVGDGFHGFIPKVLDASGFVAAVRRVLDGDTFSPQIPAPQHIYTPNKYTFLTGRQLEVCERVRLGMTNREIAADLKIAGHTVEKQLSDLFRIFNVRNRTELAVLLCEE